MKNFKILSCSVLLAGMSLLSSCEDFLTKTPIADLSNEAYWTSEADLKAWRAGTYNGVQKIVSSTLLAWGELRSDDFYMTLYANAALQLNSLDSNGSYCDWEKLYQVINRCNLAIENIPAMDLTEDVSASYLGQFHGLRALMYFYAVRVWGEVPLIDKSWNGNTNTKYNSRASLDAIYELIEGDLKVAISSLGNEGVYYFNLGAAYALQMDYLMWRKDYAGALKASDNLLALTRYEMVATPTDWKKIFTDPTVSKETIFTIQWDFEKNNNNGYGGPIGVGGSNAHYQLADRLFQRMLEDKKDIRFWGVVDTLSIYNGLDKQTLTPGSSQIIYGSTGALANKLCKFFPIKTTDPAVEFDIPSASGCQFEVPVYRLADVMLMRAEAMIYENKPAQDIIDIVNQIRSRCGSTLVAVAEDYPVRTGVNNPNLPVKSLEQLVLNERQLEFYGESKRWFDIVRTGYVNEIMDPHIKYIQLMRNEEPTGFGSDLRRVRFPLAKGVFTSNPALVGHQNEPYSE